MVKSGTHNQANIYGVIGASGTGKSSFIKGELLKKLPARLLIWSPLEETDQYAGFAQAKVCRTVSDLVESLKAGQHRLVFWPTSNIKVEFDRVCRVAWSIPGVTFLVEELSNVTLPGWAPPAWKKISTAGRHHGMTVIGTSQRPSQVDKDFFGNCTQIRCYRLVYEGDAKTMASVMREQKEAFMDLENFHFFHRWIADRRTITGGPAGQVREKSLTPAKKIPVKTPRKTLRKPVKPRV